MPSVINIFNFNLIYAINVYLITEGKYFEFLAAEKKVVKIRSKKKRNKVVAMRI